MRQHYVPQFYLKLFADPEVPLIETDYLWEVNLPTGSVKKRAPKNVANRPDYYKIPGVPDEAAQKAEETFSQLESVAAPILRRLASGDLSLVDQNRTDMLLFLAFMAIRVPTFRKQMDEFYEQVGRKMLMVSASHRGHFTETLRKVTEQEGEPMLSDEEVEKHRRWALNPDNYTLTPNPGLSLMHGFQLATETIFPIFRQMKWAFFRAPKEVPFITFDCPLSWYDPTPRPAVYGGHGLGLKNVEVTFPITPTVTMLGTHNGPHGIHEASVGQALLFNVRKLYWVEQFAYAASNESARRARALALLAATQAIQARQQRSATVDPMGTISTTQ